MIRRLVAFALLAAAADASPAATPSIESQARAIASNCSIAIAGPVNNSNILACPIFPTLQEIGDFVRTQDVDPLLIQLIRQGSYEDAFARIERLAAAPGAKSSLYLSIGASIAAARNMPREALSFAERAHRADPSDAMLVLRYTAALDVNRRGDEAAALIESIHRRRSEFTGIGPHLLDVAKLQNDYPYETLNGWRGKLDRCLGQAPGAGPVRARTGAGCALDPAAQQSLRGLRDRASQLDRALAAADPGARMPLQTRHYVLQYVLIADELLQDPARAAKTEWKMTGLGREMLKRFGPWTYLLAVQSEYHLDLVTTPAHLRLKYQLFDLALQAAPASPVVNLGSGTPDEELLPKLSGIMLASFRLVRANAANLMNENAVAWENLRLAREEAARYGDVPVPVGLRVRILFFATELIGTADPSFDRAAIAAEHRRLKAAFSRDPELRRASGAMFDRVSTSLCRAGALAEGDCRGS